VLHQIRRDKLRELRASSPLTAANGHAAAAPSPPAPPLDNFSHVCGG
jgi:hypothetical protein